MRLTAYIYLQVEWFSNFYNQHANGSRTVTWRYEEPDTRLEELGQRYKSLKAAYPLQGWKMFQEVDTPEGLESIFLNAKGEGVVLTLGIV